jgi:hypothetical protein
MRRLAFTFCILLAGCGKAPVAPVPETDPAIADALADPVMADPGLALSQGRTGQVGVPVGVAPILPPDLPTLGQRIAANRKGAFAGCGDRLVYGYGWSAKLPAPLALPGDAKVIEAAGQDAARCNLRIIRYAVAAVPADALRYWQGIKGFSVAQVDSSVVGTSGSNSFYATASAASQGATIDLIVRSN